MTKNKINIEVIGNNADSVTGSCTKITTREHTYLFELGMIQDGNTPLENYHLNQKLLQKIKPQDIDFIMVGHNHADHIGLIPALYAHGKCKAKIIVPAKSKAILKEMWLDSAFINERDVEKLNLKGKNYEAFYYQDDVYDTLEYVQELPSNEIIELSDELSIRYSPAGHILLSQQAEVFIKSNGNVKKILFTSDLGNIKTLKSRIFVENFKPVSTANIVIGEATYAARSRKLTKKNIDTDMDKIKTVITQYCVDNKHRVLIPSFSLDRTPYVLWLLYTMFGSDKNFNIPILIDSPLTNRLLDCYSNVLEGEAKDNFDSMMSWKNIVRIVNPEDSKAAILDKKPKVILSSSGMLQAGRSVKWAQSILPCAEDAILFMGYCGQDTLGWKIKHEKQQKTININGKPYKNKCQIIDLTSFSSHMQRDDLINYYKGIHCEKIYLVHSNANEKLEFKHDLETALSECLMSTKVSAVGRNMKFTI